MAYNFRKISKLSCQLIKDISSIPYSSPQDGCTRACIRVQESFKYAFFSQQSSFSVYLITFTLLTTTYNTGALQLASTSVEAVTAKIERQLGELQAKEQELIQKEQRLKELEVVVNEREMKCEEKEEQLRRDVAALEMEKVQFAIKRMKMDEMEKRMADNVSKISQLVKLNIGM